MEIKILNEKNNPLFSRKEIKAIVEAEVAPNRKEMLELISKKFSFPAENVKIKGIKGNFGTKTFTIDANIYSSASEKDAVEIKKKKEGAVKSEKPKENK